MLGFVIRWKQVGNGLCFERILVLVGFVYFLVGFFGQIGYVVVDGEVLFEMKYVRRICCVYHYVVIGMFEPESGQFSYFVFQFLEIFFVVMGLEVHGKHPMLVFVIEGGVLNSLVKDQKIVWYVI